MAYFRPIPPPLSVKGRFVANPADMTPLEARRASKRVEFDHLPDSHDADGIDRDIRACFRVGRFGR